MIQVVLQQSVPHLGRKNDVKRVRDGYFRNFLFPRGFAVPATEGRLKSLEQWRGKEEEAKKQSLTQAKGLCEKLEGMRVILKEKVTGKNTLYAAVGAHEIAAVLSEKLGITLSPDFIVLADPIKKTGKHGITVKFSDELQAKINLEVKAQK